MNNTYKPSIDPSVYGLHIPYNQGYDARSRAKAPRADDDPRQSGYFSASWIQAKGAATSRIALWVTDITADFSLNGQTGQSRMLREFFPRSFNDVTLRITGNVASTQEYNRLALFIREAHWRQISAINSGVTLSQTITFGLYDQTPTSWNPAGRTPDQVRGDSSFALNNTAGVKGKHRPMQVQGYVKSIAAGAVRHEVGPEFTVEFIVAESQFSPNTGIWSEITVPGIPLPDFRQLVNIANGKDRVQGPGFIQDPTAKPAAAPPKTNPVETVWSVIAGKLTFGLA